MSRVSCLLIGLLVFQASNCLFFTDLVNSIKNTNQKMHDVRKKIDTTIPEYYHYHLDDNFDNFGDDIFSLLNPDQIESILELDELSLDFPRIDPEAYMTVPEIIQYHGYPVETYKVQTDDGYILTIQRIPHGKNTTQKIFSPKKPVLLQHGLFCSSSIWVTNTPDKNLPYILADVGYDVWLGNVRGTVFGNENIYYTPDDRKFWEFSFDEMAKYDVPRIIDKILEVTNFPKIYYIGHSMGTMIGFALLSSQPRYNTIVKGFFALAPVATVTHMRSVLRYLTPFHEELGFVFNILENGEFQASEPVVKLLSSTVCNSPIKIICENVLFLISGFDYTQFNASRLPVYLHHTPAATSVQNMVHLSQIYLAKKFQFHDFGALTNVKKYGQLKPPIYNLSQISAPVALFYGDNDYLSDPKDVFWLSKQLKSVFFKYRVPYEKFAHLDFIWAIDVKSLVFDKLIEVMNKI